MALGVLQVLALPERDPFTQTLSSYEYTDWGWLFPLSLVLFGVGILLLVAQLARTARTPRALLTGAAVASWVTALFPSGDSAAGGSWWGEVHRWGSIALVVLVLGATLLLRRSGQLAAGSRVALRLVLVAAGAGAAFLAGQAVKSPEASLLGQAPLAGGLTQRILVAAVAAALLVIAAHATVSRGRPTA